MRSKVPNIDLLLLLNLFLFHKSKESLFQEIYFETTQDKKISKIENLKCDFFIDDLPQVLHNLSRNTVKILFDYNKIYNDYVNVKIVRNWRQINSFFQK